LQRLYRATSDERLLNSARAAIEYERSVFSPIAHNWPDLRRSGNNEAGRFLCQWCHGAAGIGLARLDCLHEFDGEALRSEIESALRTTLALRQFGNDDLCCGNFGRIEFVFAAGQKLRRPELIDQALAMAGILVDKFKRHGDFVWKTGSQRQNPGFHTGISGVGYELLRLTRPGSLPSVLLWE
jgi:lantibiotic modifying enzyme